MANHIDRSSCLLISISATNRDSLFDCYRDYLVFMSLVRDAVRCCQFNVYGFCWLKNHCLMIIRPENNDLGNQLLHLLKRYHFWLLQRGPALSEFKLQMLKLQETSWLLDCLRYLHQQPVVKNIVDDPMDYHWHSQHVYNGFWSMHWLDTSYILTKFADNHLVAKNLFRQYMQHKSQLDFGKMLSSDDCTNDYINNSGSQNSGRQQLVSDVNSQYHQSMLDRTRIRLVYDHSILLISIRVADTEHFDENNVNIFLKLMKFSPN